MENLKNNAVRPRIAVLGGGIAGISAAFWLTEFLPQAEITLYEAQNRLGGLIGTKRESGCLLETGPLVFPAGETTTGDMLRLAGLGPMLIPASQGGSMGIWDGERLIPLPRSPWKFLTSCLISPLGFMRLLLEPFMPRGKRPEADTVHDFFRRRTGEEFLECFLEPYSAAILSGDPATMSMSANLPELQSMERQFGSLAMGFGKKIFLQGLKRFRAHKTKLPNHPESVTCKKGSQGIIDALTLELQRRRVQLCFSHQVKALTREPLYRLCVESQTGKGEKFFDGVVSCLPSHRLASLVPSWPNEFQTFLNGIPHAPIVIAHATLDKPALAGTFKGEGCLLQSHAGQGVLSVVFPSRMAAARCPKGLELIRVMLGGARRTNIVFYGEAAIHKFAGQVIQKILNPKGERKDFPCIRHTRGLPQLFVGHERGLKALEHWLEHRMPGFFLSGTSFSGAGIDKAVRSGKKAAKEAAEYYSMKWS